MSSLHTYLSRNQSRDQREFLYFLPFYKIYVYLTEGHENKDLIKIYKGNSELWHFCLRSDINTALPLSGMLLLKQECIKVLIPPHWQRCSAYKKQLRRKKQAGCSSSQTRFLFQLSGRWVIVSEPSRQTNACPIHWYSPLPPVACITGFAFCMVSMPTYKKG